MQEHTKKNLVVIGALLLPILLIVGVFVASKLESSLVHTEYDFVYATCDYNSGDWYGNCNEYLSKTYAVLGNRIVIDSSPILVDRNYDGILEPATSRPVMRVFLHDTDSNISRELLEEEVKALSIDPRLSSPDGVAVESGASGSGVDVFFFDIGSSYSYDYYLMKGSKKSLLNLTTGTDTYYYGGNLKFIGWVTN